jgi:hypothetical protein
LGNTWGPRSHHVNVLQLPDNLALRDSALGMAFLPKLIGTIATMLCCRGISGEWFG